MYIQTLAGLGQPKLALDLDRAARLNRRYSQALGWLAHYDRIVGLLGFTDSTPGEGLFAEAIANWQQNQGLTPDGILGPKGWVRMRAALGLALYPNVNTQLPSPGVGYYRYQPHEEQYGLPEAIQAIRTIGGVWARRYPRGPRIGIGDISLHGGGPHPPHMSHQKGLDVDIRPVRSDGVEAPVKFGSAEYSAQLTQELVNLIRENGVLPVKFIFFNDQNIQGVRHWPGHDDHLHVRFIEPS